MALDARQTQIIESLMVRPTFDPDTEIALRRQFLVDQLQQSGLKSFVLGISGGVDSLVAGLLAQQAVQQARRQGLDAQFIAMRLPYGTQKDEHEAQQCMDIIQPDKALTIDIKPSCMGMLLALQQQGLLNGDPAKTDFVYGNIKARQRMIAQYAIANEYSGLVIGTDHAAEAVMGFFTKHGDGAADVTPLAGLNKRRIRTLAKVLGAPEHLAGKVATADLEDLSPLKPDEVSYGISYDEIDDFLEGKPVSDRARDIIFKQYALTAHKRALPTFPIARGDNGLPR